MTKASGNGQIEPGQFKFTVNDDGTFTITGKLVPVEDASLSKSGKSVNVCSSRGNTLVVAHKGVVVKGGFNLYVPVQN